MFGAPVLALKICRTLHLETDASMMSQGVVLSQYGCPIPFYSHALPSSVRPRSAYEMEFFAWVIAVKKWKHYLIFMPFMVKTDQISLKLQNHNDKHWRDINFNKGDMVYLKVRPYWLKSMSKKNLHPNTLGHMKYWKNRDQ